ncbi:hypothetical protein [Pelagovum pacificum]|uniref:Uncharacterized protein n=1 Tax=Pelagovum pacificum TaxID=2588711 RepID=A0A5C5GI02_9RHOB|nr:hypothetical protein [Pelagovum pacificum]QQA42639.1 hypothetical protein I8N54_17965 [Pelagovum pacificum]TNY34210.1 hypothetical protein FHY64_13425 [Pelagovum pacificum]
MILPLILATASLLAATQASALSCLRPDPATAFQRAADASEEYVVLNGTFTFDETAMPGDVTPDGPEAPPAHVPATFSGNYLTADGFVETYEGPLTLAPVCAGPWCGSLDAPADMLAFALLQDGAMTVEISPCYDMVFTDPSREALMKVVSCMQGGDCSPLE